MHSSHMLREGARSERFGGEHGSREYRRDPECLWQELVGRASGCGDRGCRGRNQSRSNAEKEEKKNQP